MHLLSDFCEPILVVEPSADSVFLEHIQSQDRVQGGRLVHKCPSDSLTLKLRMDKKAAYFVVYQSDETDHSITVVIDPGLRELQMGLSDEFSFGDQKCLVEERMRQP